LRGTDPAAAKRPAVTKAGGSVVDPAVGDARRASPPSSTQLVKVSMSGPYSFEVFDGARSISAPSKAHDLPSLPIGKMLRVVAEDVFLDRAVKVDAGTDNSFEYNAPGLGKLDIRAARQDCKIMVGKHDFGYPPLAPVPVVAGDYQVTLACPDGQNPVLPATVTSGRAASVRFQK
jgi:hypothetical protein